MEPKSTRLRQEQEQDHEQQHAHVSQQASAGHEFKSVEEMLRFDANHTTVPTELRTRLEGKLAAEKQPTKSWWRRWLHLRTKAHQ